jgi:hypothetical protein
MPSLVEKTEDGRRGGIWEVKWTWMPAFLAMDTNLVKAVDEKLNQLFAGGDPPIPGVLDRAVIKEICRRYPMTGLGEALQALVAVDPTVKLHLVDDALTLQGEVSTASGTPLQPSDEPPRGGDAA